MKPPDGRAAILMEQVALDRRDVARVIFTTCGSCPILLFLFWNPLVLHPRFWNVKVVIWSLSIDTALGLMGVGLILLRRWAALLASLMAVYLVIDLERRGGGVGVGLILGLLTPTLLTLVFWRDLKWGEKRRDPLWALAILIGSGLIVYAAFLIHHATVTATPCCATSPRRICHRMLLSGGTGTSRQDTDLHS